MAVCVAVIGKENYPLFLRTVSPEEELKFHYTVHTSLDVVEEKVSSLTKSSNDPRELYLGLYGYVTNTKIKFVVMFRKLHVAYTDMFCNPFYNPGENITSRIFERTVIGMMKQD
ncbi:Trafficking protein particle complex subunit 2-like protein [Acropora cervicornis]|uniref:Trafficking protein particle complex subunit 2-like protein n=1 Tax=Acropora cervicornis TaxID=6130 RepID=A0AAD9PWK9_ACRCE|nr:Trafficking protein particle complex subunit 2-like protein [Acropora cervicornis]